MNTTCCYSQSEIVPEKRELSAVEAGDQENKVMKRRRRSASLSYGEQQQPTMFKIDQVASNAATTNAINNKATAVKRSSRFRGVSRHRWTGRYEAHLWDKGSWNVTQKKKGKQGAVYLGAYDVEEAAARAYDLAAIKYWGTSTYTNFPTSVYEKEIEIMRNMSKEEYLASLRRRSSGFARGASKYRGVARHHQNGRWEARIGRVFGNKYLYLGTYGTQEEAAKAYDIAAIEYRGMNAVTNFDMSTYIRWLKPNNENNSFALSSSSDQIFPARSIYLNQESDPASSFAVNNFTIFRKHEIIERKMPLSPCKKETSPTALGLLLRSSMYKELIEKTTNEENEHNEVQPHDGSAFDHVGNENRVGFGPKKEDDSVTYDREGMFYRDFFPYGE